MPNILKCVHHVSGPYTGVWGNPQKNTLRAGGWVKKPGFYHPNNHGPVRLRQEGSVRYVSARGSAEGAQPCRLSRPCPCLSGVSKGGRAPLAGVSGEPPEEHLEGGWVGGWAKSTEFYNPLRLACPNGPKELGVRSAAKPPAPVLTQSQSGGGVQRGRSPFCRVFEGVPQNHHLEVG